VSLFYLLNTLLISILTSHTEFTRPSLIGILIFFGVAKFQTELVEKKKKILKITKLSNSNIDGLVLSKTYFINQMQMGKTTFKMCRPISLATDDAQWV